MASTASTRLRLELQTTGENLNSWGSRLNTALQLVEDAVAGVFEKSLTGNYTLTTTNYATDEARNAVLVFTDGGLGAQPTVTIPAVEKVYFVQNQGATYDITFDCGGTTADAPADIWCIIICDGTDVFVWDPEGNASANAATATSQAGYAEEWAVKAEDSLISAAAGGDESTDYSALHHALKAAASAAAASTSETNAANSEASVSYPVSYAAQSLSASEKKQAQTNITGRVTEVVSSAVSEVDIDLPSGFSLYRIEFFGVIPSTDGANLALRVSIDGGLSFISTSSYANQYDLAIGSSASATSATGTSAGISPPIDNNTVGNNTLRGSGKLYLGSGSLRTMLRVQSETYISDGSGVRIDDMATIIAAGGSVDAIRFIMSAGNISVGTFLVEGIA